MTQDTFEPSDAETIARNHDAARKKAVDEIAEAFFGIRPEHGDGIYTQHPIMAGVVRRALRLAWSHGGADFMREMLRTLVKL